MFTHRFRTKLKRHNNFMLVKYYSFFFYSPSYLSWCHFEHIVNSLEKLTASLFAQWRRPIMFQPTTYLSCSKRDGPLNLVSKAWHRLVSFQKNSQDRSFNTAFTATLQHYVSLYGEADPDWVNTLMKLFQYTIRKKGRTDIAAEEQKVQEAQLGIQNLGCVSPVTISNFRWVIL